MIWKSKAKDLKIEMGVSKFVLLQECFQMPTAPRSLLCPEIFWISTDSLKLFGRFSLHPPKFRLGCSQWNACWSFKSALGPEIKQRVVVNSEKFWEGILQCRREIDHLSSRLKG